MMDDNWGSTTTRRSRVVRRGDVESASLVALRVSLTLLGGFAAEDSLRGSTELYQLGHLGSVEFTQHHRAVDGARLLQKSAVLVFVDCETGGEFVDGSEPDLAPSLRACHAGDGAEAND